MITVIIFTKNSIAFYQNSYLRWDIIMRKIQIYKSHQQQLHIQ